MTALGPTPTVRRLPPSPRAAREAAKVVVSSLASDSHTWNLIFLQLLLEELGHQVTNLGACVPEALLADECERLAPDLIVLSSVNGHGFQDGARAIAALHERPALAATPVVIGGKLGTAGPDPRHTRLLLEAGFDAVFQDDAQGVLSFRSFLAELPSGASR